VVDVSGLASVAGTGSAGFVSVAGAATAGVGSVGLAASAGLSSVFLAFLPNSPFNLAFRSLIAFGAVSNTVLVADFEN